MLIYETYQFLSPLIQSKRPVSPNLFVSFVEIANKQRDLLLFALWRSSAIILKCLASVYALTVDCCQTHANCLLIAFVINSTGTSLRQFLLLSYISFIHRSERRYIVGFLHRIKDFIGFLCVSDTFVRLANNR